MIAELTIATTPTYLVEQHLPLAKNITARLKRRYHWVASEDLYSYSLLGLTLAVHIWQPDRGVSFGSFAKEKAMFIAIDEMRRDRVLRRETSSHFRTVSLNQTDENYQKEYEIADPRGQEGLDELEVRDLIEKVLLSLSPDDRHLLEMYYSDDMTFVEIAKVLGVTQSTVCLRHKTILSQLRRRVKVEVGQEVEIP